MLKKIFTFITLCAFVNVYGTNLPEIGLSADQVFSPAEEQEIGQQFMRQLRQQVKIIDDPEVENYFNSIGYQLAANSENPAQPFTFFVVKAQDINAFAVPGGFVGVHSGLILQTRDESELASVLAHEIAHVTQRHIARKIEEGGKLSLISVAAIIAAVLAGARNADLGQAGLAAIMAGNVQMQIDFTRAHEREADRVGIETLSKSGFNPLSMPSFFERLQSENRFYEGSVPEFLRTHPVTTDRIAEAKDRAEKMAHQETWHKDSPEYSLMKAKILIESSDDVEALIKQLEKSLETGKFRDERAVHYGLVQAGLSLKQPEKIVPHLKWLQENDHDRVIYRHAEIQLAALQKNRDRALVLSENALKIYPKDMLISTKYAQLLLEEKRPEEAVNVLKGLTSKRPDFYRLLAQAHQEAQQMGESHLAMGESYYLNGQTGLAIEQLKQALRLKTLSFYLASRLESRVNQWEAELHDSKKDKEKQGRKNKG
jgi:beta-barrel assembly-enhancing protease